MKAILLVLVAVLMACGSPTTSQRRDDSGEITDVAKRLLSAIGNGDQAAIRDLTAPSQLGAQTTLPTSVTGQHLHDFGPADFRSVTLRAPEIQGNEATIDVGDGAEARPRGGDWFDFSNTTIFLRREHGSWYVFALE